MIARHLRQIKTPPYYRGVWVRLSRHPYFALKLGAEGGDGAKAFTTNVLAAPDFENSPGRFFDEPLRFLVIGKDA